MPPSTPHSALSTQHSAAWDLVIRPRTGWFDWRLHELWQHRDLFWLLVWRDFVTVHKQTILGPLWHVGNPILTSLIYTLIFGRVVKLPTDGLARQAWQLLSRRLHGKPSSKGGKHSKILVPPELVARATAGPPAAGA